MDNIMKKVCPKCRTAYPNVSQIKYCVCGAKLETPTSSNFEDIFPGIGDIIKEDLKGK